MRRIATALVVALGAVSHGLPAVQQQSTTVQAPQPDPRVQALIDQASAANRANKPDEAQARADESLKLAESLGDRLGLAMSYRMKGQIYGQVSMYKDALVWDQRALEAFEALDNKAGMASALRGLTIASSGLGNRTDERAYGARAVETYGALGDELGRARILLILGSNIDLREYRAYLPEVIATAERFGDRFLQAQAHKSVAEDHLRAGRYDQAALSFESAIRILESLDDLHTLAATNLSYGRVLRAHGNFAGAIEQYQKAIDLLTPTNERYTLVEATNAKAVALAYLGRHTEALAAYEQGLALAQESGNQRLIDFMEGNLAGGLMAAGEYKRAIPALEAAVAKRPERSILGYRYGSLSQALAAVGRTTEAIPFSEEAVAIAREFKQIDTLAGRLDTYAWILSKAGRLEDALAASREVVSLTEEVRTQLLPSDFLKRGYADRVQQGLARTVYLLSELGRGEEAFATAELSRARAFLDLMSARETGSTVETRSAGSGTSASGRVASLASDSLGRPLDPAGVRDVAARLKTTIISYWINEETTLIWVSKPEGSPTLTRVPVTREKLKVLVAATTAALRPVSASTTTRGGNDRSIQASATDDLVALPMRGLGIAALARDDKAAWRELHRLLIEPVRTQLPARGERITFVPHGPLFQLSYAGLQDGSGRYLVEDYELHYAPAASALAFTGRRQQAVADNHEGPWAIVGNPATLPVVGGRPLPPLPGAEREIALIAAIGPTGKVLRLNGGEANEATLAEALLTKSPAVLHFATHGFVFDDAKQPPFLALNRKGSTEGDDGRLTLDEVYGLRLQTDLVVLSACRTGAGQISSDGIVGLTRGFLYAGTPSVVSTFWDITDEATATLISSFYRRYASTHAKSRSLRAAQLALLADLRAGKVVVTAGGRRVTLPEHPLLWAAFFLSGEP